MPAHGQDGVYNINPTSFTDNGNFTVTDNNTGLFGDKGIQHRSRGKRSSRRLPEKLVLRVVQLYQEKYQGFGRTLMSEKLLELEGIEISKETIRTLLIDAGQWQTGRKVRTHRQWRECLDTGENSIVIHNYISYHTQNLALP